MFTTPRGTEAPRDDGVPRDLAEALALYTDRLGIFANRVQWYTEVTSTNVVASLLADRGAVEGTVVGAEMQTAGRGRQGRTWSSPPGVGLYVSAILRPPERIASLLTIAAGVALADGIREATGLEISLKWPNDVYVGRHKLAGILAEASASSTSVSPVVLGFGINVLSAAYPPEVASRATSIELELGRTVDRGLVLAACLASLASRYSQLIGGEGSSVIDAWRSHAAATLGRPVECKIGVRAITGIAEDIDAAGALLVRTGTDLVRVISGEVLWP